VDEFILLDFLMGSSIADVMSRYGFATRADVEQVLRAMLLRHGYGARDRDAQ
jgi:hypothetical protein